MYMEISKLPVIWYWSILNSDAVGEHFTSERKLQWTYVHPAGSITALVNCDYSRD
jgi:putative NADH-flavin reductase